MTKENFDSNYAPIIMPKPFADEGDKTLPANTQDAASGFSFPLGFSSVYSSPKSNNGKYVTRKQMNAIGNLATHNDFHRRCGGLNTFDAGFAEKIGGYPKGAVLQYFNGQNVLNLISLVDNNMSNFLVDGISPDHWRVSGEKAPDDYFVGLSYNSTVGSSGASIMAVGSFRAPLDGVVTIANLKSSFNTQDFVEENDPVGELAGSGVLVLKNSYDFSYTSATYKKFTVLSSFGKSELSVLENNSTSPSYVPIQCFAGDFITIGIQNGWYSSGFTVYRREPVTLSFEVRIV